jgi:DNA-directed RNA polymerase subunit K/omega
MAKYLVNPIKVKMKESQKGSIYESIVAMGFRARQINDDMRYELRLKMQNIVQSAEESEAVNPDQTEISKNFERYPKATFIAMKEIFDNKLKFNYVNIEEELGQLKFDTE